jgi:alginate O-acetyltransferase complex protein AlgI
MDFASLAFIGWISLLVIGSWILPNRFLPYFLIAVGLAIVVHISPIAGIILIAESAICFYVSQKGIRRRGTVGLISISFVFIAFLMCKYFASKNQIALPLGISYFTFRLIHYVQESTKNRLREHRLEEFLAYMTFFPTYLVGPINLFPEFLLNLRRRRWDYQQFFSGLERVVYGFAQLIIIGNFLISHLLKDWIAVHTPDNVHFSSLIIHSVHLWLDLYIRFSAYSSIAIGISAMAGFSIPENFNFPFLASDIREFWQRWHMSLTNWCREYIFVPVAALTRKPFLAIGVTMITIGIWHELSLRYVLWGFYHATGIVLFEKFSKLTVGITADNKSTKMARKVVGTVLTLVFVILSFPITTLINNILMEIFK